MSQAGLILVVVVVFGAVLNVVSWWILDGLFGFAGRFGLMANPVTMAIVGAIGGGVMGHKFLEHRARKLADLDDPPETVSPHSEAGGHEGHREEAAFPKLTAFQLADERIVRPVGTERVDGEAVELHNVTLIDHSSEGSSDRTVRTIALLAAEGFPAFYLRPRRWSDNLLSSIGSVGLSFDARGVNGLENARRVRDFANRFRLTGVSHEQMISGVMEEPPEGAIRRLFSLSSMKVLVSRPHLSVESADGRLAVWHGGDLGRKRRRQLAVDAIAVRSALLAAHTGQDKSPIVPAPPGSSPALRQAARLQASMLGGVIGAFAGFFTSAVINAGRFFKAPFGERAAQFEADGAIFLLCIMAGAGLGMLVGVSLPLQRPLLRKPDDPRREKVVGCFILAGLFLGGLLGGLGGILAGEWLNLGVDDAARRAQLFFAGVGTGTILCPIVLGVTVNTLYKLISGRD